MKLVTGIFLAGFLGIIGAQVSLCELVFPTSFDNNALKKFAGKNVTAKGNWTTRTKMERAILGPDGGVIYIHSNYSTNTTKSKQNGHPGRAADLRSPAFSKLDELPEQQKKIFDLFSENQPVVVSGVLQHYVPPKLSRKSLTEQVASIPDHFYFEQSKVTVNAAR